MSVAVLASPAKATPAKMGVNISPCGWSARDRVGRKRQAIANTAMPSSIHSTGTTRQPTFVVNHEPMSGDVTNSAGTRAA